MKKRQNYLVEIFFIIIFVLNYFITWVWSVYIWTFITEIVDWIAPENLLIIPDIIGNFLIFTIRIILSFFFSFLSYRIYLKSKNKKLFWSFYGLFLVFYFILWVIAIYPIGGI